MPVLTFSGLGHNPLHVVSVSHMHGSVFRQEWVVQSRQDALGGERPTAELREDCMLLA